MPILAPQFLDSVRLCITVKFPGDAEAPSPLLFINLCHQSHQSHCMSLLVGLTIFPVF